MADVKVVVENMEVEGDDSRTAFEHGRDGQRLIRIGVVSVCETAVGVVSAQPHDPVERFILGDRVALIVDGEPYPGIRRTLPECGRV